MDGPIRGKWHCPHTVSCRFEWTDNRVRGRWHCVLRTDGPVRVGRDCPHSVLCWFGRTDTLVWGQWHGQPTVPYMFGRTDGPAQCGGGRWMVRLGAIGTTCSLRLVCSGRRLVCFEADNTAKTAHAPCRVGSGRPTVWFGANSMAKSAHAPCRDGCSSSKWMGWDFLRSVPCGFGWMESPIWGGWHYSRIVPCMFGQVDYSVRGG